MVFWTIKHQNKWFLVRGITGLEETHKDHQRLVTVLFRTEITVQGITLALSSALASNTPQNVKLNSIYSLGGLQLANCLCRYFISHIYGGFVCVRQP